MLRLSLTHPKPHLQTDSITPNNVGSFIVRLHVAKSVTGFKLCATTPNNTQQHEQGVQIKRTQHLISNNIASVCTGA